MSLASVIAICGAKRSGKDTLADHLVARYGYEKIKLADPIKHVVKYLFAFDDNQVGESDDKDIIDPKWNITPRKAMQFFGTDMMQYKLQELLPNIGRKFWINRLMTKLDPNKKYVISDLRFVHEYEELNKINTFIIKVDRPTNTSIDKHASESEYTNIPVHLFIRNDKSIQTMLIEFDNSLDQSCFSQNF